VATALGTGLLTLPFAFSSVGIVTGMVMLTAACSLAGLSLAILILSSRYTEVETFAGLLALASGSSSAGILLDAVQVMYCLSAVLALLMFEGDFVPAVIEFVQEAAKPERNMCIIGVACVVWPLVLPSDLASLRYFASLLPYAIAVLAVSVLVQMPQLYIDRPKGSEVTLFGTGSAISQLQSTSIFVFSVMCHVNAVPVGKSLERPSVSRIVKVAAYSNLICWVLYALIGIGGYMSFQSMIQGDFLLGYAADCWPILIARSLLVIVCYVGVPLNLTPCVKALRNLISAVASRGRVPTAEESGLMHAVFASVLLVVATGAALYFRSVATVISVLGGSLATLQMFWLPAYIYWKILYSTQPQGFRVGVMVSMVSVGILGFASVLSHLF
jgi:amino acid permease